MASYYVWSAAAGSANGTSWVNAYTKLGTAFGSKAAGDIFYVAHDHSETTAGGVTLTAPGTAALPVKIICVDRAGTVPPVSADRRTTAVIATTGVSFITFAQTATNGHAHYDGIIFLAGDAASVSTLNVASTHGQFLRLDNCSLRLRGNSGSDKIEFGASANGTHVELNNTTMSFAGTAQVVNAVNVVRWRGTASALIGAAVPTTLFTALNAKSADVECAGVDLSAAGSGKTLVGAIATAQAARFRFIDCKLHASVTKSAVPTGFGSVVVDFIRSGSSGVNYNVHSHRLNGLLIEETTIVRTGGASDGTTPISWKVVTTANCSFSAPFECPVIAIWNDTTGAPVTATVEGVWGGGAVPLDNEIFLEVEYLSDASSPVASFVNDGTPDLLTTAANQTSSSETWGGSTTKFKMSVTFTAQMAGWVYGRIKVGKASMTVYIDPLITLS